MLKEKLSHYYVSLKETNENSKLQKNQSVEASRLEASIIKSLHAIEKGLCLEAPRLGFGIKRINELFELIEKYMAIKDNDPFCLYMARDALSAYLDFHAEKGFCNADIEAVREKNAWLSAQLPEREGCFGGFMKLRTDDMDFSTEQIENLFRTRHSIREFSGESVDQEDIKKAIELAQLCPSACNRQCTRVYFVDTKKYTTEMQTDLQGVGGFADDAYGFLLITAKKSAYAMSERHQHLVSAAIFAGYLSLALHAYSIAACTVQRSVSPNALWDNFKKINNIADDEQIVVMLAIGKYKEETKVPVSKRFPTDSIYRVLK